MKYNNEKALNGKHYSRPYVTLLILCEFCDIFEARMSYRSRTSVQVGFIHKSSRYFLDPFTSCQLMFYIPMPPTDVRFPKKYGLKGVCIKWWFLHKSNSF